MGKLVISESIGGDSWLSAVAGNQEEAAILLSRPEEEQRELGYFHTLHEILQQPATWLRTGREMASVSGKMLELVEGIATIILTGSGSSEYAGECVRILLQNSLGVPAETIGGGVLLTHGGRAIAGGRPGLMISLARSGDSPESVGAVSTILETEPEIRHLVVTCNAEGRLATTYLGDPRVEVVVLAEETNDRSLVMTSSFTNMVLAASSLAMLRDTDTYLRLAMDLSKIAEVLLLNYFDVLARVARRDFDRVVYLASGARLGAARESALKMLEMTAGSVWTTCETYLGLRHGPLSAVHSDSLIVCFLSSEPLVRAYECDLIRELNDKQLGMAKLIFGEDVPVDLIHSEDVVIDCEGLAKLGDENMPVLDLILGQSLAFFRCLKDGLKPDSPSTDGVINRVVQEFKLHGLES